MSGAVNQVLNDRDELQKNFNTFEQIAKEAGAIYKIYAQQSLKLLNEPRSFRLFLLMKPNAPERASVP